MPSSATVMHRDEADRVKALLEYEILDTLPDPAFDEIARLAASSSGAPYAFIGFIDWSRVWFKSRIGFSSRQIPRTSSACQFVVMEGRPALIGDMSKDSRFPAQGLELSKDIRCRSYAAAPLLTASGAVIGTLAVCSPEAEAFERSTLDNLQVLARQVVTRLDLYAKSHQQERVLRSRQRTEQALTIERNFVSAVLDTISALVLVLDTSGRIVRFNRASETLSGYSFADLVGRAFPEELFPEQERERAIAMFERARSGRSGEASEINWRSKAGRLLRISWTTTSLTDAHGAISFIIMTGVDVTAQREAEEALHTTEIRYRQLVESSLGVVSTHDLGGTLSSINPHAGAILGYNPEEMIGTPLRRYIDEAHLSEYDEYLEAIRRNSEHRGLFHLKRRDGGTVIVAYRNKIIEVPGAAPFVLSHGIDITEQTQAQEELHALMSEHESILESVGDGICGLDLEGRITFVNGSGARLCGYTPEEMQGKKLHALVHHSHPDGSPYPAEHCPISESLKHASPLSVNDDVFWRKDGSSFAVEYVACPLMGGDRVRGTVVAFQDITERRRLDRMKDEFISTVSHELRTPLTSLRASLGLLAGGALEKRPEKVSQMFEIALNNCDRLVRLVNDIVDFERIGAGNLTLNRSDWNTFELLRRATEVERASVSHAGLSFRVDAQSADVWVDGERILQTLSSLIQNAIKFSEKGGEIRLTAAVTGEKEVTFTVQDQGRGISPENLDVIFERFRQEDASDSRSSGGTGLGLAICRSIIQQHGGRIWADSAPGEGSTFYFTVPRSAASGDSKPEPQKDAPA
ncbi:MAG TPA: PAS domain S-box protein [Acidobacteriaceae bacterium]|nr:PAS domain S-box protein [Acidobacteriaceae bacterium]